MPSIDSSSSLLAQYQHQAALAPDVSERVAHMKHAGIAAFQRLGMPSRKDEEWRFTPITPIVETDFAAGKPCAGAGMQLVREHSYKGLDCHRIVFANGAFAADLSDISRLPEGVLAGSLRAALEAGDVPGETLGHVAETAHNGFTALNAAFLNDGAFVAIPPRTELELPIHVIFLSDAPNGATVSHPRLLAIAGASSRATLIESYGGPDGHVYLTNAVSEFIVHANASLDHYRIQRESTSAYHIGFSQTELADDSRFTSCSVALGGAITRNETGARLSGENAACTLDGVYFADGRRLVDNHTAIDHAMPHCESHELYKGILGGKARGVFNGKIMVRPAAQKTDAKQTNKTLLLSDEAQINTKPQLEIFADDVRCTHGATVGQLDDDALFYLRARGIGREAARDMLIEAFAGEVLQGVTLIPVRERIGELLSRCLPHHE